MRIDSPYSGSGMIYGADRILNPLPARERTGADDPLSSTKARDAVAGWLMSQNDGSSDMSIQERQVLARERAIKASAAGTSVSTTYTYATGPDGRKYIVGAEVSVVGSEDELDSVPGGTRTGKNSGVRLSVGEPDEAAGDEEDKPTEAAVQKLKEIEREVIAHEAAHKAAAGRFGGPVSYTYTTGPDGKKYITGGEVPISTPSTSNPEEALRNATQVMKAALAPGDPSGQDIAVAASAAQMAASARAQISSGEGGAKKPGGAKPAASQPAGAPVKDEAPASPEPKAKRAGREREASDAYSAQVSPKGLWTTSRGYDDKIPAIFEELQPGSEVHVEWDKKSAEFEIAA